jgi:hypothetical protein
MICGRVSERWLEAKKLPHPLADYSVTPKDPGVLIKIKIRLCLQLSDCGISDRPHAVFFGFYVSRQNKDYACD